MAPSRRSLLALILCAVSLHASFEGKRFEVGFTRPNTRYPRPLSGIAAFRVLVAANEGAIIAPKRAEGAANGSRRKLGRSLIRACLGGAAPKPPEFIA